MPWRGDNHNDGNGNDDDDSDGNNSIHHHHNENHTNENDDENENGNSHSHSVIKKTTKSLKVFSSGSNSSGDSSSQGEDGGEKKAEDIPPEDYAIVVELLDCETGDEIQEKADLMAKNGLITAGGVEAARVILDGNIQQGQDEEIILILRAIYDVLLKELQKIRTVGRIHTSM